ncbi:TolC family outer membrane protein [Agaribacterium haliotis]|uniref:TolC family outer membrane protein n=1 Tax=Agaribacterium haliotis TaxID=2013869 RepID=UPI000BB53237|nr:TolC family outer membrane protein [Agaribacterium haliotis]
MRFRYWGLLWALGFSPMSSALTLEQAVASAIDNNPEVQHQYARFRAMGSERRAAKGGYLPSVAVYGGTGVEDTRYNSGQKIDADLDRRELGLSISQQLFAGFRTDAEVKRLSYEAESERYQLMVTAENIALTVTELYLQVIKAQEIVALSERNVADHKKTLDDVHSRMSKGLSSRSDYAQISARLATARASLASAQNNLADLRARFLSQVNLPPYNLNTPNADVAMLPANVSELITKARDQHPSILEAKADIKAAKQEFRGAKSKHYPEVTLDFVANKNDNIGGFEGPDEDARLMLNFRYELYNGGSDHARVKASGWRYQEALSLQKRTIIQVEEGAKLSWNARYFLEQQQSLYKENVDAATEATLGYKEQFNLGRRSLLDVLDSKIELFLARRNYINAEYDARLADYRVHNAMGTLLYALRVDYPEEWKTEDN